MQGDHTPEDAIENHSAARYEEYLEVPLENDAASEEKLEKDSIEYSLELVPNPEEQWNLQASVDIDSEKSIPSVVQLEEDDLDYTENLFSTVILKESENSELIKFMAKKHKSDDINRIEGERIHFTETGEKYITRNGLRIVLKPIAEPHEVEAKNLSALETYMIAVFFALILIIALVCSELLYIEFGKVGYIPFGVIALSIVHGVTFFSCKDHMRVGLQNEQQRTETCEIAEEFMD